MRDLKKLIILAILPIASLQACAQDSDDKKERKDRPNILIAITDDQSWRPSTFAGDSYISTPNVDKIASEGFRFENAYAASPGCAPSRAALLTGQHHWMIGAAGTHASSFPAHYETFVDVLEEAGYKVGFTGKGWGPGIANGADGNASDRSASSDSSDGCKR